MEANGYRQLYSYFKISSFFILQNKEINYAIILILG